MADERKLEPDEKVVVAITEREPEPTDEPRPDYDDLKNYFDDKWAAIFLEPSHIDGQEIPMVIVRADDPTKGAQDAAQCYLHMIAGIFNAGDKPELLSQLLNGTILVKNLLRDEGLVIYLQAKDVEGQLRRSMELADQFKGRNSIHAGGEVKGRVEDELAGLGEINTNHRSKTNH